MKVAKLTLIGGCGPCVFSQLEGLLEDIRIWWKEGDGDTAITIQFAEMSEEEVEALPEFEGY